jgi:phospholipase/carboxylesterase
MTSADSAPAEELAVVERATGPNPAATIVWLHGLGADGHDFEPIVPELQVPGGLRFVFPHAPVRPVTVNAGYPMRAWYDISSLDGRPPKDEAGFRSSVAGVHRLVARELAAGFPPERVMVAGFSQGGSIALFAGLTYPERLGGIVGLSTWLPFADALERERTAANGDTPVLLCHGSLDPVVPEAGGRKAAEWLHALGYPVDWHTYRMPHAVCPDEIADLRDWLGARLGPAD